MVEEEMEKFGDIRKQAAAKREKLPASPSVTCECQDKAHPSESVRWVYPCRPCLFELGSETPTWIQPINHASLWVRLPRLDPLKCGLNLQLVSVLRAA